MVVELFLEENISSNIILVVAGRAVIERSIQSYQRDWQKHKNTIYPILLDSFTEDETKEYLSAQGIIEPKRISTLLQLSRGLPYSLSLLTSNTHEEVDLTKDVVDNFLRGIPEHEEMKRQLALEAALLTRPFNQDDLKAFVYLSENDWPILYRWLSEQPFVRSNPQDGRHSYHDLARETFTRHLYQISPTRYQSTREALADHYRILLKKIKKEAGKGFNKIPEWLELVIALAHQLFLLPDEESHIRAIEQILEAYRYTSKEQDSEVIRFLREISQKEPTNMASEDARQIAKLLIQYIETNPEKRAQEFLASASFLIDKLKRASSVLSLLSRIYCERGDCYLSLKRYQQALDDYNQAIKLNTSLIRAYTARANVYNQLDRYEDALLELNRALEIEPDNEFVLLSRGSIYEHMKCYEEALSDFERISESEFKFKPVALSEKGIIQYKMGKYQEAAKSLTEAVRIESTFALSWIWLARAYQVLHPYQEIPGLLKALSVPKRNSAKVITNRALAMEDTGYYEEAIVEATRAIELEPKYVSAIIKRGFAYLKLDSLEEAVNDFSLALKINPNDNEALFYRGQAYNSMKHYSDALHDFNAALGENSPNNSFVFYFRSQTYRHMGQYKEALHDLDHAVEQNRNLEHPVQEQRVEVLKKSGKKEEALSTILEAVKSNSTCIRCWINLAESFGDLYSRREVPRRLRGVTVLDKHDPSVIACRAEAMSHIRYKEEAMAELARALELDPDNELALRVRSKIYHYWDCFEEALSDLDHLVEQTRFLKHWKHEKRGAALQQLGRNQEALTAFLEALKTDTTCEACWRSLAETYEVLEGRSKTMKWL